MLLKGVFFPLLSLFLYIWFGAHTTFFCVHFFTFLSGLLLTNSVPNSFYHHLSGKHSSLQWPASAEVMLFTQKCCKAGMNHSLFVVSHEESPGMWDAISNTGLVSELLFVVQFKCVREGKEVLWWENSDVMGRDSSCLGWL